MFRDDNRLNMGDGQFRKGQRHPRDLNTAFCAHIDLILRLR